MSHLNYFPLFSCPSSQKILATPILILCSYDKDSVVMCVALTEMENRRPSDAVDSDGTSQQQSDGQMQENQQRIASDDTSPVVDTGNNNWTHAVDTRHDSNQIVDTRPGDGVV